MSALDYIKNSIKEDCVLSMLERYGAKNIRKLGDTYRCTCPIHGGDNATAFSYNPDNNLWCCFTECGGGDIFTLVSLLNDIDIENNFKEVIRQTAQELRLDITGMDIGSHEVSYKREVNDWLKYALKRQEIFNIPYDLSKLGTRYLLNEYRGISKETLKHFGVGYLKEINKYIFPIYDLQNNTIGASLRATGSQTPKWVHRPKSIKTGDILYNAKHCIDNGYRTVYVVEGIIDAIRLYDIGIDNVVCTFGARITDAQKLILMNFDEVILAFDNDKAGKEAILKAIEKLKKIINIKILILPEGIKDVGEFKEIGELGECEIVSWITYTKEVK